MRFSGDEFRLVLKIICSIIVLQTGAQVVLQFIYSMCLAPSIIFCFCFPEEKAVATIKILLCLLPMSGRNRLSAAEAFSKIFHIVPVCSKSLLVLIDYFHSFTNQLLWLLYSNCASLLKNTFEHWLLQFPGKLSSVTLGLINMSASGFRLLVIFCSMPEIFIKVKKFSITNSFL